MFVFKFFFLIFVLLSIFEIKQYLVKKSSYSFEFFNTRNFIFSTFIQQNMLLLLSNGLGRISYFVSNWILSTNHRRIAVMYFIFAIITGFTGLILATIIRIELAYPGQGILNNNSEKYLTIASLHAIVMVFFVVIPVLFGAFGNFLLPTQLGIRDVAFPRLNSFMFWITPAGFVLLLHILLFDKSYNLTYWLNYSELKTQLKRRHYEVTNLDMQMHLNKDFSILATRLANFSEEDKAELRNILLAKKSPARYQIITSPLEFTKTFISNSLEKFRDTIRQRLTTALNISDATVFAVYDAIVQFELSVFVLLSNLHSCYLTILMSTQPVFFSVTNALAYCRFTHEYLTPHIVKKCSKRVLGGDANYVMIVSRDSYNDCLAFFGLPADNYSPVIVKRAIQFGKRVEDFIFEPLYIMYAYICYIRETPARLSEKFHARYFLINPRNEINAIRDLERQTGVKVTYVWVLEWYDRMLHGPKFRRTRNYLYGVKVRRNLCVDPNDKYLYIKMMDLIFGHPSTGLIFCENRSYIRIFFLVLYNCLIKITDLILISKDIPMVIYSFKLRQRCSVFISSLYEVIPTLSYYTIISVWPHVVISYLTYFVLQISWVSFMGIVQVISNFTFSFTYIAHKLSFYTLQKNPLFWDNVEFLGFILSRLPYIPAIFNQPIIFSYTFNVHSLFESQKNSTFAHFLVTQTLCPAGSFVFVFNAFASLNVHKLIAPSITFYNPIWLSLEKSAISSTLIQFCKSIKLQYFGSLSLQPIVRIPGPLNATYKLPSNFVKFEPRSLMRLNSKAISFYKNRFMFKQYFYLLTHLDYLNDWRQLKFEREIWRSIDNLAAARQHWLGRKKYYASFYSPASSISKVSIWMPNHLIPGWAYITPYTSRLRYTSLGKVDVSLIVVLLASLGSVFSAINYVITYRYIGAPILKNRKELRSFYVDALLVGSRMMIVANPALIIGILLLLSDRHLNTSVFDFSGGGDTILFQHLFWFFGHPEVYIVIIPCFGFMNSLMPYYLRKRLSGRLSLQFSMYTIAFMSFAVWGHHMYMVGLANSVRTLYSTGTVMISVPASTKILHWCVTLIQSSLSCDVGFLFLLAFMYFFVLGGLSGMFVAHLGFDVIFHDTFYVIGHFHVMFACAAMCCIFAGFYFYFSSIFGVRYSRFFAYLHFFFFCIGQLITIIPMIFLGYAGMPRRIMDYPSVFGGWHSVISSGHFLIVLSFVFFFCMLLDSFFENKAPISKTKGVSRLNTRLGFFAYEIRKLQYYRSKSQMLLRPGKKKKKNNVSKVYQLGYFAELVNFEYVFVDEAIKTKQN